MEYKPEALPYVFGLMQEVLDKMPEEHRIDPYGFPNGMVTVQGNCRFGYLGMNIERLPTEEEKNIVARFAREFGRIYQRVLDLEKAEDQAREAQIEAALEKVRSASMVMHQSEDIGQVLNVFYAQLQSIGMNPSNTYCVIYPTPDTWTVRMTDRAGNSVSAETEVSTDAIPVWRESYEHWKSSGDYAAFVIPYTQEQLPVVFESLDVVISKNETRTPAQG